MNPIVENPVDPGARSGVAGVPLCDGGGGAHSGGADFCGSGACSALSARRGPMHALHEPFARGRDVDQDAIADACVWQSIGLFQPAPDSARMAARVSGKWLEIDEVVEKIRL
jgi:hypothetical protein